MNFLKSRYLGSRAYRPARHQKCAGTCVKTLARDGNADNMRAPTAGRAVSVMGVGLADDQELIAPLDHLQLRPLDAGEGLKRRAGGAAAVRAVAIHGVAELIGHGVEDGTAIARARESAGGGVLQIGHWLVTLISLVALCKIPLSQSM